MGLPTTNTTTSFIYIYIYIVSEVCIGTGYTDFSHGKTSDTSVTICI